MAIGNSIDKSLEQVDFKKCNSGNGGGYGGGSSARLNVICRKCGKKGHFQKNLVKGKKSQWETIQ